LTINKKELIEWINFQYLNLVASYTKIGGYYFKFDQLSEILSSKTKLEKELNVLSNQINIKSNLKVQPSLKSLITRLKQAKNDLTRKSDLIITKIKVKNKFYEEVELQLTYDELLYIYNNLSYLREDIEHFKTFLLEELENIEAKDEKGFYIFINDYCEEIKDKMAEKIPIK